MGATGDIAKVTPIVNNVSRRRKPRSFDKRKGSTLSVVKLSNKKLNKLAKRGKLKDKIDQRSLHRVLKERTALKNDVTPKPNIEEEEDIPLEEADYEYFATPQRDFSFLSDINLQSEKKRKRRKPEKEDLNDYEQKPRGTLGKEKRALKTLLPIKTKDGGVQRRTTQQDPREANGHKEKEDEEVAGTDEEVEEEEVEEKEELPPMTTAQLFVYRKEKLAICKRRLALLADTIMEDPESNMSKLKEMRMMLDESDPLIALSVKKLTAFSLLEVFKDILPDYRIRVATDKEKEGQAKKETKKLREFEEGILANYKAYLDFLDNIVKGKEEKHQDRRKRRHEKMKKSSCQLFYTPQAKRQLVMVALKCLCELMVAHPHFNFRTNIIALVIPFACKFNPELSNLVCEYVRKIFKSDKSGESSLEIARLIGRVVKVTKFRVSERVLETFLSLKIKEINKEHMSKQDAAKKRDAIRRMSRKDKKDKKHMIHLEKELEDVALEKSREQRVKLHTQIVSIIFLTYFRILKFARNSKLLSTVLAGLAKFAHFINVDFFDDLFSVLKELVISGTLTNTESLNCIQTAFTILSGQGSALNIDPLMFYTHLYNVLLRLNASESSQDVSIALECLDIMFNQRRKQVSMPRTLAFMKRLGILSLQMQSNGALGMLAAVRNILLNIPRSEVLLDTECEGSGSYMPDLDEPEYCNAHNTALYELHAMRRHYHPVVRQYSDHVLGGAPSEGRRALNLDLSRKAATELFQKYDASDMTFTPVISEKPKQIKQKGPMYPQGVFPEFKLDSERIQASLTDADFDNVDFSSYKKRRKTQS